MSRCIVIRLDDYRPRTLQSAKLRDARTWIATCLVLGASCIGFLVAIVLLSGCGGADPGPVGTTAAEAKSGGVFCIEPWAGAGGPTWDQLTCSTTKPLSFCPPGTGAATACAPGSTASNEAPCTLVDTGCGGGTLVACCPGFPYAVTTCQPVTAAQAASPPSPPCYSQTVGSSYYWCC
ncbi:MAG TPA: hypothetical protein VN894_17770 [Polyangiaceae bacterium]|nr:hypothetical protein [Polyangiaceae bacterium]